MRSFIFYILVCNVVGQHKSIKLSVVFCVIVDVCIE